MKSFAVFAGDTYYPDGGWDDFISSHDFEYAARDKARDLIASEGKNWSHVVDLEKGIMIAAFVPFMDLTPDGEAEHNAAISKGLGWSPKPEQIAKMGVREEPLD